MPRQFDDLTQRFSHALARLRAERRLSYGDLAEAAGLSPATVWDLEGGRKSPTWRVACALADALGVGLEAFRADPPGPRAAPARISEKK